MDSFDDGVQDTHESDGLRGRETFGFEAGNEFERVEMVLFGLGGGGGEGGGRRGGGGEGEAGGAVE